MFSPSGSLGGGARDPYGSGGGGGGGGPAAGMTRRATAQVMLSSSNSGWYGNGSPGESGGGCMQSVAASDTCTPLPCAQFMLPLHPLQVHMATGLMAMPQVACTPHLAGPPQGLSASRHCCSSKSSSSSRWGT
jgi:hypothetical protein